MSASPGGTMLSAHFSTAEISCHCCGRLPAEETGLRRLLAALEQLRTLAGSPIHVDSAYRCPEHNAQVGGQPDSRHLTGEAADVVLAGRSVPGMVPLALLVPAFRDGGIGAYDGGFIHVDVRSGGPARWSRVQGKYESIEALILNGESR